MTDRPWLMRTYSGHTSARASNELYRTNLAKGQTGLSIAFDLPTQTGYDPDHPMARGEVGKVGVPVPHLGEMRTLFDGIPIEEMNTSMTINATAMWLLGLYVALAEERGVDPARLTGTTQNDIVKEYLSRGTHIFPPEPSKRLTVDLVTHTVRHVPRWNPINVCSYHLQEAGATPVQEIAYAMATACGVLDAVRESGQVRPEGLPAVVGRISFFVNAGIRFVEETCKLRAMSRLWDRLCRDRYGVADEKLRRFRYGVQVNSLGLTEQQPENNVPRIVLEALGVTLSRSARARAIQLPAWNEALGLPRPWDQQWSLRIQQILAYETDLLEYDDLLDGSRVVEAKTAELEEAADAELAWVLDGGGAFAMIDALKGRLVQSHAERVRRVESGEQEVVGLNCFTETEPSPLVEGLEGEASILVVDPAAEAEQLEHLEAWRARRDPDAVAAAIDLVRETALTSDNLMAATVTLAQAGGTVGEWAGALRDVFGEYRAPTGVGAVAAAPVASMASVREQVRAAASELGGPIRLLVGKPGLDGHSNGAEQVAVAARDAGMEVVYQGIRLTPAQIAAAARDEDVDVVGLSILSGSHLELVPETLRLLRESGVHVPVVVGGIVPEADQPKLLEAGVARVYTPKDFRLVDIMADLAELGIAARRGEAGGEKRLRRAPEPVDGTPMMDHRLVVSACAAVAALAAGVMAALTGAAGLGLVAGVAGLVAGIAAAAIGVKARTAEDQLARAAEDLQRLRREVDTLAAALAEEASLQSARSALGDERMDGSDGSSASDPAATGVVDRVSGLLEQRFLGVLVHQRVAAARRQLQPVSVVLFEVDGLGSADDEVKNQALGVLGEVIRSTLRECDAACRIGDLMAGAVLLDTTEAGAMWAAERVRGNLLASPVGSELTISAGIACYPTHALGAAELVEMAGRALERAREQGYDRVEIAPTD